jgi:hypothetical protein
MMPMLAVPTQSTNGNLVPSSRPDGAGAGIQPLIGFKSAVSIDPFQIDQIKFAPG